MKRIEDSLFYFAEDVPTEKVSWAEAEQKCKTWFGAHLASIHSAKEEEKIKWANFSPRLQYVLRI